MYKKFVITKNVKKFVDSMDTLKQAPPNLPKMALVYGDFGLGKSQTIMWWVTNNDAIYVRCNHKMSPRWLLSEIVRDLHDKIGIPIVLTGMGLAEQKLKRFKHIYDRLLGVLKFETF